MTEDPRSEAWEQHLDWSLRAIEGGEMPPDVTARVQEIVSGQRAGSEGVGGRRRMLVAAAAAILAIGAVVGVRMLVSQSDGAEHGTAVTQDPENHIVDDPEDVAALPADARRVTVLRQGDDVLEQIAERCPRLQHLCVNGIGEAVRQPTNRVFAIAARLPELLELQLVRTVGVNGAGIDELLDLPRLETLVLAMTTLEPACFAVLPRLPSLRVLDLSYSRGVDAAALRHIARCPGLRQLGIPGCKEVSSEALGHIAELTRLEILEARELRCSFDDFPIERLDRLVTADLAGAEFTAPWLRRLPASLRKLTLSQTAVDDDGCVVLAERLAELRDLRVSGTAVGDRGVVALMRLAELRMLDLGTCAAVTGASLEPLASHPLLTSVDLTRASWVAPENVEPLFERGIGVRVDTPVGRTLEPLWRRHAGALEARARRAGAGAK